MHGATLVAGCFTTLNWCSGQIIKGLLLMSNYNNYYDMHRIKLTIQ